MTLLLVCEETEFVVGLLLLLVEEEGLGGGEGARRGSWVGREEGE